MARSWLEIGEVITIDQARPEEEDIVIFKRGGDNEPGPEIINAPGHVGFYVGMIDHDIMVLGGNQGDMVSIGSYPIRNLLGVRRLRQLVRPIDLGGVA